MDQRTGIHIVRMAAFSVATLLGACSGEPTPEGASGVAPGAPSPSRTTSVTAVARVATPASTAPPKTGVPAGKGGEGGIVAFTKGVAHVTATGGTAADEDLPLTVGARGPAGTPADLEFRKPGMRVSASVGQTATVSLVVRELTVFPRSTSSSSPIEACTVTITKNEPTSIAGTFSCPEVRYSDVGRQGGEGSVRGSFEASAN